MKNELNDYKINNPDGANREIFNECKTSYSNDDPRFVKENAAEDQVETIITAENPDGKTQNYADRNSVPSSETAGKTVTGKTSVLRGDYLALAGSLAASVMTAAIVVAVVVSTLTVNLTLLMATMSSLVFKVDISGAQEGDFNRSIICLLDDGTGDSRIQEIGLDMQYITFDDLEPGKEYVVTVKNEEKVLFQKSYFTSSGESQRGYIYAFCEVGEVYVYVEEVRLNAGEFYTVTAKDEKGSVVFVKDDVETDKEFVFNAEKPTTLYFTLSIGGTVIAFDQTFVQPEPVESEYDTSAAEWTWGENYDYAEVSFPSLIGGDPLEIRTVDIERIYKEAACEENAYYVYYASIEYNYETFTDERRQEVENTAVGHDYGEPEWIWTEDRDGGYFAEAVFTCSRNSEHQVTVTAEVSLDGDIYYAEVEFEGNYYNAEYRVSPNG